MAVAAELVRVVARGERLVVSGSSAGRGAWLCARSPACVDLARRRGGFARALRRPVDDAVVAALAATLVPAAPDTSTERFGRSPDGTAVGLAGTNRERANIEGCGKRSGTD